MARDGSKREFVWIAWQWCYKKELNQPSLWSWHGNGEQCHAVCATIAWASAILNPSIILCFLWAALSFVCFPPRDVSSLSLLRLYLCCTPLSFSIKHKSTTSPKISRPFSPPSLSLFLSPGVRPSGSRGSCWAPGPRWALPRWTPSWWKWTGATPDSVAAAPEPHTDSSASRWSVVGRGGKKMKEMNDERKSWGWKVHCHIHCLIICGSRVGLEVYSGLKLILVQVLVPFWH